MYKQLALITGLKNLKLEISNGKLAIKYTSKSRFQGPCSRSKQNSPVKTIPKRIDNKNHGKQLQKH